MQLIILRHTGNRIKVSNQNLDSKKRYREMAPKSLFEVVKVKVKKKKNKKGPNIFPPALQYATSRSIKQCKSRELLHGPAKYTEVRLDHKYSCTWNGKFHVNGKTNAFKTRSFN